MMLTVRDFIKLLSKENQDAVICVDDHGDLYAVEEFDLRPIPTEGEEWDVSGGGGVNTTTKDILAITTRS